VTHDGVTYDCFKLDKEEGTKRVFKPSKKGLFHSSVNNNLVLVITVEDKIFK